MNAPPTPDVLEVIRQSAEICREATRATMHVELGYDERSILLIDELIATSWNGPPKDSGTYQAWGCFLGEALCAVLGGRWIQTHAGLGIALNGPDNASRHLFVAYPLAKIEKKFRNPSGESVSFFYRVLKSQNISKRDRSCSATER